VVLDITAEKNLVYQFALLELVKAKHFFDGDNICFFAVNVEVLAIYHRRV